VKEEVAL